MPRTSLKRDINDNAIAHTDPRSRTVTYWKRSKGLHTKADDLSHLCSQKIAVIVPDDHNEDRRFVVHTPEFVDSESRHKSLQEKGDAEELCKSVHAAVDAMKAQPGCNVRNLKLALQVCRWLVRHDDRPPLDAEDGSVLGIKPLSVEVVNPRPTGSHEAQ